jgi:hypothetical protein
VPDQSPRVAIVVPLPELPRSQSENIAIESLDSLDGAANRLALAPPDLDTRGTALEHLAFERAARLLAAFPGGWPLLRLLKSPDSGAGGRT